MPIVKFAAVSLLVLSTAACGTRLEDRALSGAGIGAATGAVGSAIIGGPVIAGAAVGAAAGAIVGAVTNARQIDLNR